MSLADELVSVVIPAYNSAPTLDATLRSVRAQTHRNLEIVVVNDGSTDETEAVAAGHCAKDPRIAVVAIPNGGLPNARNTGIRATRGRFIAPVDADDLWHPTKIARQLAVFAASGPEMGLVYTAHRTIDMEDRVIGSGPLGDLHGWVYLPSLLVNFVGNGSAMMFRREAAEQVQGYDATMIRGSEDRLFQTLVARRWSVGQVPAYLTGYRQRPGSMNHNYERMSLARLQMIETLARRQPETPARWLDAARAHIRAGYGLVLLQKRKPVAGAREMARAVALSPACALSYLSWRVPVHMKRLADRLLNRRPAEAGLNFCDCAPDAFPAPFNFEGLGWLVARLARDESRFRATSDGAAPIALAS